MGFGRRVMSSASLSFFVVPYWEEDVGSGSVGSLSCPEARMAWIFFRAPLRTKNSEVIHSFIRHPLYNANCGTCAVLP